MSYLFYIDSYDNTVLHPDAIKLCPELRVLDEKQIAVLIYAYDYHSIYRQYPEAERIRKSLLKVYGSIDEKVFDKPKMVAAVEAYMSLQYNPKVESARMYQKVIDGLNSDLMTLKDEREISRILKSIGVLEKKIDEMENEITEETIKEGKVFGDAKLSFLEMLQKNQVLYKTVMVGKK